MLTLDKAKAVYYRVQDHTKTEYPKRVLEPMTRPFKQSDPTGGAGVSM